MMTLSRRFNGVSLLVFGALTMTPPASAADVQIGQLRFTKDQTTTTYINLKASDTSLTEAEWRTALNGTDLAAANAILARLTASRVTIERIEVDTKQAGTTTQFVLKTVDMARIVNGRAAAIGTGRGEMRTATGKDRDFIPHSPSKSLISLS